MVKFWVVDVRKAMAAGESCLCCIDIFDRWPKNIARALYIRQDM